MKLDPTKPVQCKNGRQAKIYEVYRNEIHGAWRKADDDDVPGKWNSTTWTIDGEDRNCSSLGGFDLINIPEKHERWINIYSENHHTAEAFNTKDRADMCATNRATRIACIKVNFTEGEGL